MLTNTANYQMALHLGDEVSRQDGRDEIVVGEII